MLTYWYFHLPNFILAALMYTLLGRVVLALYRLSRTPQTISGASFAGSPNRSCPQSLTSLLRQQRPWSSGYSAWSGCSGCASALAQCVSDFGRSPKAQLTGMERNYYYVGIAFFGMINGLFNEDALIFTLIHMQILGPPCCLAACH